MDELLEAAVAQRQFLMRLLASFGAAAVALALLGLYGVISYSVSQRTREIGIRIAIGARQSDVSRLVMRQGLTLAVAGMIAGAVAGLLIARLVQAQLFGVMPFDGSTLTVVAAVISTTAAVAVYGPARRAARVDPIVALRSDG
jgi:ABC-type antimicrobial peptide transport system permease subunit